MRDARIGILYPGMAVADCSFIPGYEIRALQALLTWI